MIMGIYENYEEIFGELWGMMGELWGIAPPARIAPHPPPWAMAETDR